MINNERIVTVYSDRMILLWDMSSKEKVNVMRALYSHNGPIYDLDVLSSSTQEITKFATWSTDKTIRFWNFFDYSDSKLQKLVNRNIYWKELEKIIYASEDNYDHFKVNEFEDDADVGSWIDPYMQLRWLKVSPDWKHVACGDLTGSIKVFDLASNELITHLHSHTQEVVSLDYSPFIDNDNNYLLASGSRDRNIFIYKGSDSYSNVNQLEGHSSSIISVKFSFDPDEQDETKRVKLLTWGADKTIIYRNIESPEAINIYHKEVHKNKIVAMETQGSKVLTGHDKLVTVSDLRTHAKFYEK